MFGIIISVIVLITMGYLILKNYKPQVRRIKSLSNNFTAKWASFWGLR